MATKSAQPISSNSATQAPNGKSEERAGKIHRMPRTLAGTPAPAEDGNRKALLALYEKALTLLGNGKYNEAHTAFTALLDGAPHDLGDRIRMYIAACVSQIHQGTTEFRTHEERYDYAISLLNHGQYDEASEHFKHILLENESADYPFYGLALLASMVGRSHECLEHLEKAIRLNPMNRIQARGDSDFSNMTDDPRFTDLLYPES